MTGIAEVPDGPAIVVANEFFDALPIRQFVRAERGWRERLVGLDAMAALAFGLARPSAGPTDRRRGRRRRRSKPSPPASRLIGALAGRVARKAAARRSSSTTACAGPASAIRCRRCSGIAYADPLAEPGEADLTAHVDFAALAAAARPRARPCMAR